MRDRQYINSLLVFALVAGATLAGIVSLPYWLGWGGAVGLLTIAGGFLAWFYWGPRADLKPRGRGDRPDRRENE